MYAANQGCMLRSTDKLEYGRHVVLRRRLRRCRAHAPAISSVFFFDHEERVAWSTIAMHLCGSVPIWLWCSAISYMYLKQVE